MAQNAVHPNDPAASPALSRRGLLAAIGGVATSAAFSSAGVAQEPVENVRAGGLPVIQRRQSCDTPTSRQTVCDYEQSLSRFGGRLANPVRQLFVTAERRDELHFSVAIIGSGYGASICAARLSQSLRPGHRLCILERGREWVPGTFPDTFSTVWGNTRQQMTGPTRGQVNNPLGLYNISFNDEVNVLSGSALGGTSVINANVAMRPHPETFQRSAWPSAIRDIETLVPWYDLAARQLSLSRTPYDQVAKVQRRRFTAENLAYRGVHYDRSPVAVMYDYRYLDEAMRNPQGMIQRPCTLCGDCITGCNVGAKNTLVYNYLPIAKWNGAEMYTQVHVDRIERQSGYYRIHLTYVDDHDGVVTRHPVVINSRVVIVSAGSPGSAEILLSSQNDQFCFSPSLGHRWSANGDAIGFVLDIPEKTSVGGFGACCSDTEAVGTTVQSTLNFFDHPCLENKFIVQDAAIPRGVTNLFRILLGDGELDHSMVMLAMGHDEGRGQVQWKDGRYQIVWPGLRDSEYRLRMFREFERIAAAEGGRYKRLRAFGSNLVSVHPLGGCAMADEPACGVVNHLGQVFDGSAGCFQGISDGPAVHPGLYVADGSVIPTALGVNPYLTICAVAERIAANLVRQPDLGDLFDVPSIQ